MLLKKLTNNFETLDNILAFTNIINKIKTSGNINLEIEGDPIITIASELGDYHLVEKLINLGTNIEAMRKNKYAYGNTALIEACRYGYYDIVKLLIEKGANLNVKNYMGISPLMFATINRHVTVVDLLLANGAIVDNPDKNNDTPLLIASYKGYYEIVERLIANGANIHHQDNDSEDALMLAKHCGHYKTLEFLKSCFNKGLTV